MDEKLNKPEPKKIKMPPLVDQTREYDTMSWYEDSFGKTNENYRQNNSQSIPELEAYETD